MKKIIIFSLLLFFVLSCGKKQNDQTEMQQTQSEAGQKVVTNLDLHEHDSTAVMQAAVLYACPMDAEYITSDPDARCVHCEMKLKPIDQVKTEKNISEITMYTCPMHPEYMTSEATDRCPLCEMKLEPVSKS